MRHKFTITDKKHTRWQIVRALFRTAHLMVNEYKVGIGLKSAWYKALIKLSHKKQTVKIGYQIADIIYILGALRCRPSRVSRNTRIMIYFNPPKLN